MKISFEAWIDPRGQGRPRASGRGGFVRMYKAKTDQLYEQQIRLAWSNAGSRKLDGAISAEIVAVFPVPKSSIGRLTAMAHANRRSCTKPSSVKSISSVPSKARLTFKADCAGKASRAEAVSNRVLGGGKA